MHNKKRLGILGEDRVVDYLKKHGFSICARNFSVKTGEIDIIAQDKRLLIFVEVKTRSSCYFHTSLVITKKKQKCIIAAAKHYLINNRCADMICRFDVALVNVSQNNIEYIPNAFCGT